MEFVTQVAPQSGGRGSLADLPPSYPAPGPQPRPPPPLPASPVTVLTVANALFSTFIWKKNMELFIPYEKSIFFIIKNNNCLLKFRKIRKMKIKAKINNFCPEALLIFVWVLFSAF